MDENIRRIVEEERKKLGMPLEARKIGSNYYLYHSTTRWDKAAKKRRKVSEYMGRIDEGSGGMVKMNRRTVYEYGNSELLFRIAEEVRPWLMESFPYHWKEIVAMGIVRALSSDPIYLINDRWGKLYSSTKMDAHLSPNTISEKLRSIGADYEAQKHFFWRMMKSSRYLIFDLSALFSRSENIVIAEKGYNPRHMNLRQVNFALLFSESDRIPVMIKMLPRSVRDISSFVQLLDEYDLKHCTIIADRGLSSYRVPEDLARRGIDYIIPLKRNLKVIDYSIKLDRSFVYMDRGINSGKQKTSYGTLYVYEDTKLRYEEETNLISLIENGRISVEDAEQRRQQLGMISIISSMDRDPRDIYLMYKKREEVELAFDSMKNELENDKSYLQDDDALRGYFFVSLISLYLYFRVLEIIRVAGLSSKLSVRKVLLELSKTYMITGATRKYYSDIPRGALELSMALGQDLYPKILWS